MQTEYHDACTMVEAPPNVSNILRFQTMVITICVALETQNFASLQIRNNGHLYYNYIELTFRYFWERVPSISTSMSIASLARLIGLWIDPEKPSGSLVIIRNHTTTVCVPSSSSVSIDRTSA